jgi:hypothetical protein
MGRACRQRNLFAALALLGAAAGGCGRASGPLPKAEQRALESAPRATAGQVYRSAADGLSFTLPTDWRILHEQGALVLVGDDRNTITVTSVKLADPRHRRTRESVTAATRRVVDGLPDARVTSSAGDVRRGSLEGASWQVTFSPPTRPGARYDREHLVLFSQDRAFHVVHTGPAGTLGGTENEFKAVVDSLKEEV